MTVLEFLITINNNYANLLSLWANIIMIIVTAIYVGFTQKQARYAKESIEAVEKQFREQKQPCVVPSIKDASGIVFDTGTYKRVQLGVNIDLENTGDSPALTVFTITSVELQFSLNEDGSKKCLDASHGPDYIQVISAGKKDTARGVFEKPEVFPLFENLTIAMNKNEERIKTNPSQHAYEGAKIIVKVLYKNMLGQWFESRLTRNLSWFYSERSRVGKSGNINENTYPPKIPDVDEPIKAQFSSPRMSPLDIKMVSDEYVTSTLLKLKDENPWISVSEHQVV